MDIRLATPADHLAWLDLWRGYQAFYKVDIDAATTAMTWQRILDDGEPMWCAVAEDDGSVRFYPDIYGHDAALLKALGWRTE